MGGFRSGQSLVMPVLGWWDASVARVAFARNSDDPAAPAAVSHDGYPKGA
jgi:hypothetical protein